MQSDLWLAQLILAFHLLIIAFNVFGLIAIPLGAWRGWRWVRIFWWRALHVFALFVVALQALLGSACFLTIWQSELQEAAGQQGYRLPLIQTWIDHPRKSSYGPAIGKIVAGGDHGDPVI
ncbi:MAG: DUF2784 domain-containing protein [Phycisphaerae bacterium]